MQIYEAQRDRKCICKQMGRDGHHMTYAISLIYTVVCTIPEVDRVTCTYSCHSPLDTTIVCRMEPLASFQCLSTQEATYTLPICGIGTSCIKRITVEGAAMKGTSTGNCSSALGMKSHEWLNKSKLNSCLFNSNVNFYRPTQQGQ